ncbi:hypothetical protein SAMN05518800_1538 [Variovorax sp. YR752]|uniref:hypothetical protein n=1 Tax=Variovorax sp. YR752 TaxID=1884383 RepID=UPI000BC88C3B|nr:hypothetical protein [Variovorax sp. YR752]SOD24706.1 hypothetical protein SAMN05518800_1538 [Variovorax sp. YR752]
MQRAVGVRLPGLIACSASVLAVLAGCGNSQASDDEQADFGASVVAHYAIVAQQKCNAAGMTDLYECAEAPSSATGERFAARTAFDVYQLFQRGCYETAGAGKCEALMETEYLKAKAQGLRRPRADVKKPLEGGFSP